MAESDQNRDRRRHPRLSVRIDAAIRTAGATHPAAVRDVSESGAFVTSPAPQPVGSELRIRMAMPGLPTDECLEGRVVRVVEVQGDAMPDHITGMGIEFKLSDEQRERLRSVLFRYVGDSEPPPPPEA